MVTLYGPTFVDEDCGPYTKTTSVVGSPSGTLIVSVACDFDEDYPWECPES